MYASCMVLILVLVLVVITGEVISTKDINDIKVSESFLISSENTRRNPMEIDKRENNKLVRLLLLPALDFHTAQSSVKHKRSSKPKAISDLKLPIQERRAQALCKFCRKSALRLKRALCKRCAQIIPSTAKKLAIPLSTIPTHQTAPIGKIKTKNPFLVKLKIPEKKRNTVPFKDKMGLLQLKHKSNAVRSEGNINNDNKNVFKKNSVKFNHSNVNKTNYQISQTKIENIKKKLFPSKLKTSDSIIGSAMKIKENNKTKLINTLSQNKSHNIEIEEKYVPGKSIMHESNVPLKLLKNNVLSTNLYENVNNETSSNIISKQNLHNIKKKLLPIKLNISDAKITNTGKSNEINNLNISNLHISNKIINPNIAQKTILSDINRMDKESDLNSTEKNVNVSKLHSRLIKFPFSNKQIKRNLDSPSAIQENLEQDKIRVLPKADGRKLLKNNGLNTKSTSEDDKKKNEIGDNKGTVLTVPLQKTRNEISNLKLQNILSKRTNQQKIILTDTNKNETAYSENIRFKRLKAINNIVDKSIKGDENELQSNKKIIKFTERDFIKKKSAFNINLNKLELPLFDAATKTESVEEKSQPPEEILPQSSARFSSIKTQGKERRSHDGLSDKSRKENVESSQIEIPAMNIQKFGENFRRNNVILLKPNGSSLSVSQRDIENASSEYILGKMNDKSDIEHDENVRLMESEIMVNDEYSQDMTKIKHNDSPEHFQRPENKLQEGKNIASENHASLNREKVDVKRSTIQVFTNAPFFNSILDKSTEVTYSVNLNENNNFETSSIILINTSDPKSVDRSENLDNGVQLRSQHFLNRKVYLKHPRITSTYEEGKHKYVLKMPRKPPYYTNHKWDNLGLPISTTTVTIPSSKLYPSTTSLPVSQNLTETYSKNKTDLGSGDSRMSKNELPQNNYIPALKETSTTIKAEQDKIIEMNGNQNLQDSQTENNEEQNIMGLKKSKINATNIRKESGHADVIKHLRSQTFLNRNVYLKHPRLKSIFENGKHKYVLREPPKPPYTSKYNLNDLELRRNIAATTEHHDLGNPVTITEMYPDVTKSIKSTTPDTEYITSLIQNNQNNKRILNNKPEFTHQEMQVPNIVDPVFRNADSQKENELLHKNDKTIQTQNKSNIDSRDLGDTNLNEGNEENISHFKNTATTEPIFYDTKKTSETFNVNTHLRTQHFLNKKVYLKHPRTSSVYENGHHKYVLKEPPKPPYRTKHTWDILGLPLTTSKTIDPNSATINFEQEVKSNKHDTISMTKNKMEETEISNFDQNDYFTPVNENEFIGSKESNDNDEHKKGDLSDTTTVINAFIGLINNKNLLSSKTDLENKDPDIFRRHINMHPEINREKYDNVSVMYGTGKELRERKGYLQEINVNIPGHSIILARTKQELLNNDEIQNNDPEKLVTADFKGKSLSKYPGNIDNLSDMKSELSVHEEKTSIPLNLGNISPDALHITENKINLPLVLKQTESGKLQLVLDTSRMCNCTNCDINNHYNNEHKNVNNVKETELSCPCMKDDTKPIFKRRTEEKLNKNPLNIYNILGQTNDMSSTNINNFLQATGDNKSKYDLKEQYFRLLIENRLLNLFQSLNIPVKNVQEIYSHINDLPSQEKQELENYLLSTITKNIDEEDNFKARKQLFDSIRSYQNSGISQSQLDLKLTTDYDIFESTTVGNYRVQLKMSDKSEEFGENSNLKDVDIKTLIRAEIKKELQKIHKSNDNNKIKVLSVDSSEYDTTKKVLNKRHQDFFDEGINDSYGDVNGQGIIRRKYKIVNNLLNWARDCIVKS